MYNTRQFADFQVFKVIGQLLNLIYVYELLKTFSYLRFVVSITRIQSRLTGYVCKLPVPVCLRRPFFGLFSYLYRVNIAEAARADYRLYTTFTDFFTRTLKPGVRPIDSPHQQHSMCSPCDGTVLTIGSVNSSDSTIDCVKGRSYRLDEFLHGNNDPESVEDLIDAVASRGNQLHYMVVYLSPGDYHRFHSPAIHKTFYRRHIAGYLSPVKPDYVRKHKDVFKQNERVNVFGAW